MMCANASGLYSSKGYCSSFLKINLQFFLNVFYHFLLGFVNVSRWADDIDAFKATLINLQHEVL